MQRRQPTPVPRRVGSFKRLCWLQKQQTLVESCDSSKVARVRVGVSSAGPSTCEAERAVARWAWQAGMAREEEGL